MVDTVEGYILRGVKEAQEILQEGLSRGYPVVLKGDPDVDGLFAWYVASRMLQEAGISYRSCVNLDRRHGLVEEEKVKPSSGRSWSLTDKYIPVEYHKNEVIINVDSSISAEEMLQLTEQGNFVISLDHHEVESNPMFPDQYVWETKEEDGFSLKTVGKAVLINNQYAGEPAELRFWSGTGVVLNALSKVLGVSIKREWVAMHGVTLLSDVRDIENPLAREILKVTYETPLVEMPVLRKLVGASQVEVSERFARSSIEKLDRTFIDYALSPYINASYQLNLWLELFRLCDESTYFYALPAKTIRSRILKHLKGYLKVKRLTGLTVLSINLDEVAELDDESMYDFKYTSFIGLIANSYLPEGQTVFITATKGGKWLRGSVRGLHSQLDYQNLFYRAGFIAKGHKSAFGITGIKKRPDMLVLSRQVRELESSLGGESFKVHSSGNLLEDMKLLQEIAYENEFLLSPHFERVAYTGFAYSVFTESAGKKGYQVDGLFVDSFDKELTPKNAYIVPYLIDGELRLVLRKTA